MKYGWYFHLFWLIGTMSKSLFLLDFKNAEESLLWLKIHLGYSCIEIERGRTPFKEKLVALLGLLIVIGIFFVIYMALGSIIKYCDLYV